MTNLLRDLRHAFRLLRLSPGFTIVAVLTLALGIGANTAIFQLIDSIRLRTIPVKRPARVGHCPHRRPPLGFRQFLEPVFPTDISDVGANPQAPGRFCRNRRLGRASRSIWPLAAKYASRKASGSAAISFTCSACIRFWASSRPRR